MDVLVIAPSRVIVTGSACVALVTTFYGARAAKADPSPKTYVVTSIGASAGGNAVAREVLTLNPAGNASRIALASADGSVLSMPVTYTSQGEIATDSQDSSVVCYNMALDVVARVRHPSGPPPTVSLQFGGSVVRVPLVVRMTQTHGSLRTTVLSGTSTGEYAGNLTAVDAGIVVSASVQEVGDELHAATFDEIHYLGVPARAVARSTCMLSERAEKRT
jgi:hypothetical protein